MKIDFPTGIFDDPRQKAIAAVALRRKRASLLAALLLLCTYLAFVLLVAYQKALLSYQIVPGLSLALAVGASTVVLALIFTYVYVAWVNRVDRESLNSIMYKKAAK